MEIWIDTADINQIKEAYKWGIVSGVTTNPSLIVKAQKKYGISDFSMQKYILSIFEITKDDPVSLEVTSTDCEGMYNQAKNLHQTFSEYGKPVIKIPINPSEENKANYDGLIVTSRLAKEGILTNVTLGFTPEQALLAARAGATYFSPFLGREDDYIKNKELKHDNGITGGADLLENIMDVLNPYGFSTKVISASIRDISHVRNSAKAGAHIATIPFKILEEMAKHEKTAEGVKLFVEDSRKVPEYEALCNYSSS